MRKKLITNEERVAKQLTTMLSDIRIDLDLVGYYLVQLSPNVIYNRLMVVADSAEEAKGNQHNDHQYRLF
jgi:hypothetical protein